MAVENFAFMDSMNLSGYSEDEKGLVRKLQQRIFEAESSVRTDYKKCGERSRGALEVLVSLAGLEYGLSWQGSNLSLDDKIRELKKYGEFSWDTNNVQYRRMDGDIGQTTNVNMVRWIGNSWSHDEDDDIKPYWPEASFKNNELCLKGLQLMVKNHFGSRIKKSVPAFNIDMSPINDMHVTSYDTPTDRITSGCSMEYMAEKKDSSGNTVAFYLIREYYKGGVTGRPYFLSRNYECFTKAARYSPLATPQGMTTVDEIVPWNFDASDYYLVSYRFNRKPVPLNTDIIKDLDAAQKISLCCDIAGCINYLHHLQTPIAHRMINHDCIYLCSFEGKLSAYVVKFDFAKIEAPKVETVFDSAFHAVTVFEGQNPKKEQEAVEKSYKARKRLSKFISPEWKRDMENKSAAEWAKADVFALGILFMDILNGEVSEEVPDLDLLAEKDDVPDELVILLEYMTSDKAQERPDMKYVKRTFDECLRALE